MGGGGGQCTESPWRVVSRDQTAFLAQGVIAYTASDNALRYKKAVWPARAGP